MPSRIAVGSASCQAISERYKTFHQHPKSSVALFSLDELINSRHCRSLERPRSSIMAFHPIQFLYSILQWVLDKLLSPTPPPPNAHLSRPKIAIIGAGLTGVSSASHCVGHGFDVTIFEAGDEKSLGGIWSVCRYPLRAELPLLNSRTESQQYFGSPDPQYNVPLPSIRPLECWISGPSTDRLPDHPTLEALRSTRTYQVQYPYYLGHPR